MTEEGAGILVPVLKMMELRSRDESLHKVSLLDAVELTIQTLIL